MNENTTDKPASQATDDPRGAGRSSMGPVVGQYFQWPRGKYNGQKITGFETSFWIDLSLWRWLPLVKWNWGEPFAIWLCFRFGAKARYHF